MNIIEVLKNNKKRVVCTVLWLIMSMAFVYLNMVLIKYVGGSIAAIAAVCSLALAVIGILLCRNPKTAFMVIEIILMIALIAACAVTAKAVSMLDNIQETVEYETVQIVALKDSGIESTDSFDSYILGYSNDDENAYTRSSEILVENSKEVSKSKPYENTEALYSDFSSGNAQLMVLTSNVKSDLSVIDEDYEDKIVVLFEKKYELGTIALKKVDITKEPFTIYLCGADLSSGEDITSTGRGDVNILLTVNPTTEQVYLQAIPRDTFVYIPCRGGSSKLSYSGWWGGVQSSIESIEDKFDIEINYYAKVNFNGLVDLVDALGGVTVYSHYTYSSGKYSFVEGYNEVDGEKALMFARARKMLPQNELSRGKHQMELIKGIFKKYAENPTYENGLAILDAMSNNFVTNLPEEDYYDAFKLVLKLLPELQEMENHSIKGEYKWHYDEVRDGHYQYYYYPADGEVEKVKNNIDAILAGKELTE